MNPQVFSWLRRVLALALLPLAALGTTAFAQDTSYVNPPDRVAQLNYFDGAVSFEPAGYDQWAAAVLNRPLTQGDRVWNDTGARSELHVGSTAVQMSGQTSLQFTRLDDQTVQIAVTQGSVAARVRELPAGQRFEIDTPNLALTASGPGQYRVDVDPSTGATTVTVRAGSVQVFGASGVPLVMPAGEQISFAGNDLQQVAATSAPPQDAFGRWAAARDAAEDRAVALRYVPPAMTGYQQLDGYGTWEDNPEYGNVWVPTVTVANWAPYRFGHWAYIAPWGWTWIDDQPWGFAPFHYGRWAYLGTRWCWVPGPRSVRPVYAPALVGFVGGRVGNVSFSVTVGGLAQPAVGWFPLGPGEVWHPAFRASPTYVTNVNRTVIVNRNVTNITNIVNVNNTTNVYRYQRMPQAVTAVSEKAFTQGEHLRGNFVHVSERELDQARVVRPPAPTRDPRAIFAASRVTQPHPAPPAAVIDRHVMDNPAFARERGGSPALRQSLPGSPQTSPQIGAPLQPHRRNEAANGPQPAAGPNPVREQNPRDQAARTEPFQRQQQMHGPQQPLRGQPATVQTEQQQDQQARTRQQALQQQQLQSQQAAAQAEQRQRLQQEQQQRAQQQRAQQEQSQREQAAAEQASRQQQALQQRQLQDRQRAQQQAEQQRMQQEQSQRRQAAAEQAQRQQQALQQRMQQEQSQQAARAAAQQAQRAQMEQQMRERQVQAQPMRQPQAEGNRAAAHGPKPQEQARPQRHRDEDRPSN
ncbi:MAG: hypothetical protein OJF60_000801 [Burkholderiaceae bacterium]|jgi:hypothetical protein|nr:MAG: hypothetical protein OJF60_000801 [Burkholderiaceae bacterium]